MAYDPKRYAENKEKYAEWDRAYRERNKEKVKLRHKIYKEANREKHAEYERKRRALKRGTKAERYTTEMVLELYGTACYLCGSQIDLTANRRVGRPGWQMGLQIDHVIPISASGSDTIDNVRPTHGICNSRKNRYNPKVKD